MLKLFWNTANNSSFDTNVIEIQGFKWKGNIWGEYHKNNSDKWIFYLLGKVEHNVIDSLGQLKAEDELIIVDSSIERKINFYTKLSLSCSKIFLFHLGDEIGLNQSKKIYDLCNHSWRIFCTNNYFKSDNVTCIPLGYKSGVEEKQIKEKPKRNYKWAFTGSVHKSSRHDLLFQLHKIKPYFIHKTKKFAEKTSLDSIAMSEILSDTDFIPCPNGVVHPETYRLYEALECGCIPIVENAYNYYDRLFPNNPFIKIDKWADVKPIIKGWGSDQVKKKREECLIWWNEEKNKIKDFVKNKIIL